MGSPRVSPHGLDDRGGGGASSTLDAFEIGVLEQQRLERQRPAGLVLDPATATAVSELVRRNPVEPRQRGAFPRPVAGGREQGRGEHLSGQVSGELRIASAPQEESEHRGKMPAIELDEGIAVAGAKPNQQVIVQVRLTRHRPFLAHDPAFVTPGSRSARRAGARDDYQR